MVRLLHSDETVVHLVTLLEALPVQETTDAAEELARADLRLGTVVVNRTSPQFLPADTLADVAKGRIDAEAVRAGLQKTGITLDEENFAGCSPRRSNTRPSSKRRRRAPDSSAKWTGRGCTCRPSPTVWTWAGCTSSRNI